jgi:hypothetical protein
MIKKIVFILLILVTTGCADKLIIKPNEKVLITLRLVDLEKNKETIFCINSFSNLNYATNVFLGIEHEPKSFNKGIGLEISSRKIKNIGFNAIIRLDASSLIEKKDSSINDNGKSLIGLSTGNDTEQEINLHILNNKKYALFIKIMGELMEKNQYLNDVVMTEEDNDYSASQ